MLASRIRLCFGVSVVCVLVHCRWVAANEVTAIHVEPQQATVVGNLSRLQIVVSLGVSNGKKSDATRIVAYKNLSPKIVAVTEQGQVAPLSNGEARIRINYKNLSSEVRINVSGITTDPVVSFREDVIPILTKAGCNQGACHATQYGQGGFKLSLLGYAPEQDLAGLTRDFQQRRISRVRPEDSLILRKAVMEVSHGGGKRFRTGSYEYNVLKSWIESGVPGPAKKEPEVVDLTVFPYERVYHKDRSQQLRVVATYSDGSTHDVTNRAKYDSMGEGVASVDRTGYVDVVGHGQAAIMVRYRGQAKVAHVISPFADNVDLAEFKPNNFVDEQMKARWQKLGVRPSGLCDDATFIRRAFIDAIGTLPTPIRVQKILISKNPNKRNELVDELLGLTGDSVRDIYTNEWSAYWALKWGDLLRNNNRKLGDGGMWSLHNWIRGSLRENKPVDQFAHEIITARGSIYQSGPANFYKIATKADDLAETTAQVFLGVRLQCARCHHHPFEVYSQADYYGLAAFFTRVGNKSSTDFGVLGGDSVIMLKSSGSIRHPRTRKTMLPTPLRGKPVDLAKVRDLRRPLADWLTSPENKLFARNIVNRIWGYFMGTGLVEPIDDMRATNPPSNPELMDALADDFSKNGFDLKRLMRNIMTSRVYQLSSKARTENAKDTRLYLHYNVKRLPAEVLLDAIDFACGTQEKFAGVPLGTRAIELPGPHYASYFLDTLGRPKRVVACECERTAEPNLAQVLHIANGDLLNRKLTDKKSRLSKFVKNNTPDYGVIAQLYLSTFSRRPTAEEVKVAAEVITTAEDRRRGFEDLLWALINSREFLFNH